ncbi:hypothetical protein PAESOLCIP111_06672 [Paenibacillus solanacearum]|uniref:DUF6884 domain-containing protein n=1 Tax=Paenibacillus solanacearum TaxID=2048548 RepID=A0A916KAV9_9BACL|nr:DUF6884 domain-containing protein [Paenibacillus solanacearum]CAG7652922.1 hypothetical protein PAESOLCIP111_06672 [Paenibacillus solanacearum]
MNKRVAFVACSKKKKAYSCEAESLYGDSQLFKFASFYCKTHYDAWFILSAKHGLVTPSDIIEPYDQTLKSASAAVKKQWTKEVFRQIQDLFGPQKPVIYLHAGKDYVEYLIPLLENAGFQCERPLKGLGVGQQQRWYKESLA